jgi:glycosyltransferase involved in cell wall biosynthesis
VALSVRLPDVLVPAEHLDPALALGLPIVASRESEAPEFAGLAWFSDDPHDLASRARAAAQERDDELPSRRRLLATERRFARLERALLARLGPQPGP